MTNLVVVHDKAVTLGHWIEKPFVDLTIEGENLAVRLFERIRVFESAVIKLFIEEIVEERIGLIVRETWRRET